MNKLAIKNKVLEEIERNSIRRDISKISLFGSYLRNEQNSDSDVDLLIEFKPAANVGFFGLSRLQDELGKSLGAEVDLVTPDSLSVYFKSEILSQAELIYEEK